jgi:hypothetical protein
MRDTSGNFSAGTITAALNGNATTTKQYLSSTGTGSFATAPAWATIAGADITGAALTKVDPSLALILTH